MKILTKYSKGWLSIKKFQKRIFFLITVYPFIWTVGIILGGLTESYSVIQFVMTTWVLAFYFGTIVWLGLIIYLYINKAISMKEIFVYVLVACIGIVTAYIVYDNDIFKSGAKFID